MRKILKGLQVSDFIHPNELANKQRALNNSLVVKAINSASEMCNAIVEPLIQGTFVQVDWSSAGKLSRIVDDVCSILDVKPVPKIYICHLMSLNITFIGTKEPYLVVPDYVLRCDDEGMLYYNVGNSIAMIKANHVELTTLAAYLPGNLFIDVPKMLFLAYLHSADSTSDRGGLLACQSFAAAARHQFWELGIPPTESRKLFSTDREAEEFTSNYLERYNQAINKYNSLLTKAARQYQRFSYIEAPANKMLNVLQKNGLDRAYNYVYHLCYPELTSSTAPTLMKSLAHVCDRFGLSTIPKVYVTRDYRSTDSPPNTFASSMTKLCWECSRGRRQQSAVGTTSSYISLGD